jgi:hypothetical protein
MTAQRREAIRKQAAAAHATPITARRNDLPCTLCGALLVLRKSMFGRYYRCSRPGCTGQHGARADGAPTSTPIIPYSPELSQARQLVLDLKAALMEACLQTGRYFRTFTREFEQVWGFRTRPETWDLDTCLKMAEHLKLLIHRASQTRYTLISDPTYLDA